jgi:chromosomal replication initiation ATPase DnaA
MTLDRTEDRPEQLPLLLGHRVARGVEDFLVAHCNRHAVEWIDRWPDWPFTALVIVGPEGSGKTHLAELWRARSSAETVDLASFDLAASGELAPSWRACLLDDADDALAQGAAAELTLLQLYNLMRSAGGAMLLTGLSPPAAWPLGLADLRSRLNTAMVIEIGPPDDALLAAVALKQFADRQIVPGEGVIPFLVSRGERSFAAIARAVTALDHAALAGKRPVTAPLARAVLAGLGDAPVPPSSSAG